MNTTAKPILLGAALILFLVASPPAANAQAPTQPTAFQQFLSGLNPANWRMPDFRKLMPGSEEKARIKKKKDGLFDEVGKTAANSWDKTKKALDPKNLNPVRFLPASARKPSASEQRKPGFFRSLFAPAPPSEPDKTVTDFLRQSRPSP